VKSILITVAMRATVSDDAKIEGICLNLSTEGVLVYADGDPVDGRVIDYETVDVAPSLPEEES
jgi:hypothetical protein